MTPYVNFKRNGVLLTTIFLTSIYSLEIFGFTVSLAALPKQQGEQIGNILILITICITAFLKLKPSKTGSVMADVLTISLAFAVTLPMVKYDDSFFNILNIAVAIFVVIFMAFCTSKEMLNYRYKNFKEYINRGNFDSINESSSDEKFLRYSSEIAKQYVIRIDKKIPEVENYDNYFTLPIESEKDYKKLSQNYYSLYRFYKHRGFDFRLVRNPKKGHAVKIQWFSQD